ncbi:MAG: zinc ABC transporter ATP-binding protein ZnuC [Porticoccaceae bacterium]
MSQPLVQLTDISKSFRGNQVLSRVNLAIQPGQIITLIGPNGAGKSTLVKIVLGLLKADTGEINHADNLHIGYMPQKMQLDPTLPITLKRFLALAEPDRDRCLSALREVGIERLLDQPLQSLSGGELQRALLARAILRQPNLLVLDEPVQGVDVVGQESLYRLIGQLREQLHCAVLMVSHDLHLVMSATDEVICLNQHICCHGHPDQVSNSPEFIELFGTKTATYTHHHNHRHNLHGDVVEPPKSHQHTGECHHD